MGVLVPGPICQAEPLHSHRGESLEGEASLAPAGLPAKLSQSFEARGVGAKSKCEVGWGRPKAAIWCGGGGSGSEGATGLGEGNWKMGREAGGLAKAQYIGLEPTSR